MELKKGDMVRIKTISNFRDELVRKRCEIIRRNLNKPNFFDVIILEGKLKGRTFTIMNEHLELEVPVWSVS